jgi:hypothetical protein
MWRYGIKEDKLNFEISEYGCYIEEYPSSHFNILSGNPEAPVVFMTCNFNGADAFGAACIDKDNRIVRLEELVSTLNMETATLAEQLKVARQQLRVLSEGRA